MQEKTQADKFREAARQLEADDSEERFNAALKQVAEKPSDDKKD